MKKLAAKKLTKKFKPATLAPGVYQTDSSTRAYPAVRYLADTGKAELVREQFLGKGKVALVIRVHGASRNPIEGEFEKTGRMRPTKEWMSKRTREYRDFKTAWWREALQNSVDAGATRIEMTCKQLPDGNWLVSCSDNGSGMTVEQVEDEQKGFLMFGGTSKTFSSTSTGAFGEAKQMLVLPWISYRLLTADKEYVGQGDEWGRRTVTPRRGVLLEVVMPADEELHTTPDHAKHVLKRSWLPGITFLLNGEVVATGTPTPTEEKKKLDEVRDEGVIWEFPKRKNEVPEVIVRKNGIWMFSEEFPQSAKHSIIVEVTGPSTRMFTSNRDGFGGWADKLRSRIKEMSAEVASEGKIRKKQRKPTEIFYRGTGQFSVGSPLPEREKELKEAMGPIPEFETGGKGTPIKKEMIDAVTAKLNAFSKEDLAKLADQLSQSQIDEGGPPPTAEEIDTLMQIMMGSPEAAKVIMSAMMIKGQSSMDAAVKQIVWQPSFYVYADEDLEYKVPPKFKPEKMTPAVLRLLKTWSEICKFILVQMGISAHYGVGFWFSTYAGAGYLYRKGQHWLLLDPHKDKSPRKEIYNPANADDLAELWAMAIHEVSHMLIQIDQGWFPDDDRPVQPASHGGDMANKQTVLQSRLAASWSAVKKIAASIKLRGAIQRSTPVTREQFAPAALGRRGKKGKIEDVDHEEVARRMNRFLTSYKLVALQGGRDQSHKEEAAINYIAMVNAILHGMLGHRKESEREGMPYVDRLLQHGENRVYDEPMWIEFADDGDAGYRVYYSIRGENQDPDVLEAIRGRMSNAERTARYHREDYPRIKSMFNYSWNNNLLEYAPVIEEKREQPKTGSTDAPTLLKHLSAFITLYDANMINGDPATDKMETTELAYGRLMSELTRGTSITDLQRNMGKLRDTYDYLLQIYSKDRVYDYPVWLKVVPTHQSNGWKYLVTIAVNCHDMSQYDCGRLNETIREAANLVLDSPVGTYHKVASLMLDDFDDEMEKNVPPIKNPTKQSGRARR